MPERYERFGWHYDALLGDCLRPGEAAFYAALAPAASHPVCEPACGSGRLLAALHAAGRPVVGLDASPAMLSLARRRLERLRAARPELARQACHLARQTLPELAGGPYAAIVLPLEGFRLLPDRPAQIAFLDAARAALVEGGRLAFDLTLPEAQLPPYHGPTTVIDEAGRQVTAVTLWRREAAFCVEETTFRWRVNGHWQSAVCEDAYRFVTAAELDELLTGQGWRILRRLADFTGAPYRPGAARLVLEAAPS